MKLSNEELLLMDPVEVYKLRVDGTINRFSPNFFSVDGVVKIEVCTKIIKYLIEEKLGWSEKQICKNLSVNVFYENGLGGMLANIFSGSPYEAIESVYPGKFKPWQLSSVPNKYWTLETGKEAVEWLIEEYLGWNKEQICQNLSQQIFYENGLRGMLSMVFNGSPYEAIESVYPGKFKPWQFSSVPRNYWKLETAKEAVKWLIEEHLEWNEEQICQNLSQKIFYENGLKGMLVSIFHNSPYEAIESVYSGRFKPWQLSNAPRNYWKLETAKEAVKWLIEEHLGWNEERICQNLSKKIFYENGLRGMLANIFHNSPYEAVNCTYPGKFKKVGRKIMKV